MLASVLMPCAMLVMLTSALGDFAFYLVTQ